MRVKGTKDLSDTIITIIYTEQEAKTINGVYIQSQIAAKEIYHHGEYDKPITLDDISRSYPSVKMVISESGLSGKIYRYGNHEKGVWEEVGETIGYA